MAITGTEKAAVKRFKDPVYHITKVQGAKLQPYQESVSMALANHSKVVVTSCHGLGKTFTAARIVLWFGSAFNKSKIITTAPNFRQVRALLWSEIRTGFQTSKHELGGDMLTTEWRLDTDWFAMGVASKHEAGSDTHGSGFQGVHAPHVLIVFDEAQGIPPDIWKQAEGMLTSGNVRMLAIGNPLRRGTPFHQATLDPYWFHVKLSCFDSPNMIANKLTNMAALREELAKLSATKIQDRIAAMEKYKVVDKNIVSAQWVLEACLKKGLTHPLVLSKVLGEFPETDENSMIPIDLLENAINKGPSALPPKYIGVDVARMGGDSTVLCLINDEGLCGIQIYNKKENTEVAGIISEIINRGGIEAVAVDATGLGSGVIDILKENRKQNFIPDITLMEVHFGAGAKTDKDKMRFANLKAQIFSDVRETLEAGFGLDNSDCWEEQLPDIRYFLDSKGRLMIESKDDYKARTGKESPDEADSLGLAIHAKLHYNKRQNFGYDLGGMNLEKTSLWGK